jgi:hypothetical protein
LCAGSSGNLRCERNETTEEKTGDEKRFA